MEKLNSWEDLRDWAKSKHYKSADKMWRYHEEHGGHMFLLVHEQELMIQGWSDSPKTAHTASVARKDLEKYLPKGTIPETLDEINNNLVLIDEEIVRVVEERIEAGELKEAGLILEKGRLSGFLIKDSIAYGQTLIQRNLRVATSENEKKSAIATNVDNKVSNFLKDHHWEQAKSFLKTAYENKEITNTIFKKLSTRINRDEKLFSKVSK